MAKANADPRTGSGGYPVTHLSKLTYAAPRIMDAVIVAALSAGVLVS